MSTGTKNLLEYKRPVDCWCCSCCETENGVETSSCRLCGSHKNDRCLTLKKWDPNISNTRYISTGSTTRLRGTFHDTNVPPAHSTGGTHTPPREYSSYSTDTPEMPGSYTPKKKSSAATWFVLIFAAIIIIAAISLVYANAAEPSLLEEVTDSTYISNDVSIQDIIQNGVIPKEVSYVL